MSSAESTGRPSAGGAGGADGAGAFGASGGEVVPAVANAVIAFLATLGGKSPRTEHTYAAGLARFQEFLDEEGLPPGVVPTDALPATILERFYAWLVRA